MCASGWRRDASLNPGRAKVTTREYPHRALPLAWGRGDQEGKFSGDHVNIMGNHEMIADVLRAVTGRGDEVEERVHSKVMELSENVHRLREARRAAKAARGARLGKRLRAVRRARETSDFEICDVSFLTVCL